TSGKVNAAVVGQVLKPLLDEVAPTVSIPGGVPVGPFTPALILDKLDLNGAAALTFPQLMFCFPNNCWQWMVVTPSVIGEGPAFTRVALEHELLHALDDWNAFQQFRTQNGEPPPAPPSACDYTHNPMKDSDAWAKYFQAFETFRQAGLAPERHAEIEGIAAAKDFNRMTPRDKLLWFRRLLYDMPPRLGPAAFADEPTLEGERLANSIFANNSPTELGLRIEMGTALQLATQQGITRTLPAGAHVADNLGYAKTLLTHFDPIWESRPGTRSVLIEDLALAQKQGSSP
ncbi:MAG TPA: hypothetical protein VGG61_10595, partial [Gemmataceae bacterium]